MVELHAGLIGANIQKTRLPFVLKALGDINNIDFSFDLIDTALIDDFDFVSCVEDLISQTWTGVTVTHPFKTSAFNLVGTLTDAPVNMGASNLLIFNNSKSHTDLKAFNTDYTGFVAAWQAVFGYRKPGKIAMAGAGGVSRAIAIALIKNGAEELAIWDLQPERAQEVARIADPMGKHAFAIPIEDSDLYIQSANGLVNATALGMFQYPGMAFKQEQIGSQDWAFDAVYTPTWTKFMSTAKDRGLECLTGFNLFKHMAIRTFQTYTGICVKLSDADRVIDPLIKDL